MSRSPAQQYDSDDVLALAERLAADSLGPRAVQYDASASHPLENWADLRAHGLLRATVPPEHGGLGLDSATYIRMIERLARGCASTAMTTNMHSIVLRVIEALGTGEQKATIYRQVVEDGALVCSFGSEPDVRPSTGTRLTLVSPVAGGFVVNGRKHFGTMAGAASYYMVHCTMKGISGMDGYQLVLVPADSKGLTIEGGWDPMGMRATVSPASRFEDCFVEPGAMLGKPGEPMRTGVMEFFGLGYAAVYLGVARQAYDMAVEHAKQQRYEDDDATLAHQAPVRRHIAEMSAELRAAVGVMEQAADGWDAAPTEAHALMAARAKYAASKAALSITSRAMHVVGGRGALRSRGLEQLLRDVRTATLMPPNEDRCLQIIASAELDTQEPGSV